MPQCCSSQNTKYAFGFFLVSILFLHSGFAKAEDKITVADEELPANIACIKNAEANYSSCIEKAKATECDEAGLSSGCGFGKSSDELLKICGGCLREIDKPLPHTIHDFSLPACDDLAKQACLSLAGLNRACELRKTMLIDNCEKEFRNEQEACGPLPPPMRFE